MFNTVAIIGVGLIGGSLGLAWRAAGYSVLGVDEMGVKLDAQERGAIHRGVTLDVAIANADVLVLATPVGEILRLAAEIGPRCRPGQIVTDVGSTKEAVVEAWEASLAPGAAFVGGHPIFGREVSGIAHADAALAHGAPYILTPGARSTADAVAAVADLATAAGARPIMMAPADHDQRVAAISHLPQVLATALAAAALELDERSGALLALAGSGFRDTTRLAGSPVDLWADILLTNQAAVREAIGAFRASLGALEGALESQDRQAIGEIFARAHEARRRLAERGA